MKNETNEGLKKNLKTMMSSDSLPKFVNFKKILETEKAPYPFIIMNTSRHNKPGVHWWSFLNIDPKTNYFYLIVKALKDLNFLLYQTNYKLLIKYCTVSIISIKEKTK